MTLLLILLPVCTIFQSLLPKTGFITAYALSVKSKQNIFSGHPLRLPVRRRKHRGTGRVPGPGLRAGVAVGLPVASVHRRSAIGMAVHEIRKCALYDLVGIPDCGAGGSCGDSPFDAPDRP